MAHPILVFMIVRYPYLGVLRSIMSYLELRLTIPELPSEFQYDAIYKHIIKELKEEPIRYIVGREQHNKCGELIKDHFHISMELEEPINLDSFRKKLNRSYGIKGNNMYCLRQHLDLKEDEQRWWRYPIKQHPAVASKGFTEVELDALHTAGLDEYNQRVKENKLAQEKMLMKNNFRNKLIKYLNNKYNGAHQPDKTIFIDIYTFYKEAHTTCPFKKMPDLIIDMKLETGMITIDEYYDIKY